MKYMADEDAALALKSAGDLSALSTKKVLVLGATGMVGSVLSYALDRAGAFVTAAGRDAKLLEERFKDAQIKTMEIFDVTNPVIIRQAVTSDSFDFIVDCAAPADPRTALEEPVEVLRDNFFGLDNVLSVLAEDVKAAERRGRKAETPVVLFVSSNAIYGHDEEGAACEKCSGVIDFTCPFGAYAVSKGASEALGAAYSRQYGLDVRVARPGIVYGPEFIPGDTRAFAVVFSKAVAGKDLTLPEGLAGLRGEVTYVSDCVAGLLAILARGEEGAYNVSNSEAEIDLATAVKGVAKEAGVEVKEEACGLPKCSDGSCCGGTSSSCCTEKEGSECCKGKDECCGKEEDKGECACGCDQDPCGCAKPSSKECSDGSCCGGTSSSCCTEKEGSECCKGKDECCGKEEGGHHFPRLVQLNCEKLRKLGWDPQIGPEDGISLSLKALKK